MIRVLFLCTGNSARSQMAEGLLRSLGGNDYDVRSAGTHPKGLSPLAVTVMAEQGIDISGHTSDLLDRYLNDPWDYVITVCDAAAEVCPVFPGGKQRLHWSFPDPAAATGAEEERLAVFRTVRDAIAERIREFLSRPVSA